MTMNWKVLLRCTAALVLALLLGACTQKNTADEQAQQAGAAPNVALGVDRLLLFPNPIGMDPFAQDGGTFETDTTQYATAYYAAIDATNAKDTIDKWRAANGFAGYATPARPGTEHLAVFRDVKDLGYGRRMTGRRNSDDASIAFYVENYNVAPNGSAGYSSTLNVDAAIRRDTQWHVGTNAIEWSTTPCLNVANGYPYNYDPPDCNGTVKFAKYYNFSSADGTRQLAVDLDGHGKKAMPGPCITCHGGRGDPLTPPDVSGNPRFPLVENSLSRKRGDVQARLHGQNVDSFGYSTTQAGFAKSDLQPFLKDFNQWILCTYPSPTPGATVTGTWVGSPCTRPTAGANEWQGTAGPMIESWYGGPGMNAATFSDTYVPAGWNTNTAVPGTTFTDTALYQNVVEPYCRTCHILRGTANQNDIDFMTLGIPAAGINPATGFRSFADRIKVHVFDRGNMPLAQIPHSDFWNSSAPQMLASFVDSQLGAGTATAGGAPLMPGRPIADPGPDRMVRTGANAVLTGENSLFASSFGWTNVSGPSTPAITNGNGMVAIFNASVAGTYVVRLTVNGGAASKDVTITVDNNFPDPLNIKFAHVKNVLQNIQHSSAQTSGKCVGCHVSPAVSPTPPIFYNSTLDRDHSGVVDATDEAWFLKAVQGRVNLTEIAASPLLRKPSGNHHKGLMLLDVADTTSGGGLSNYSILYNWILAGMQAGGVAANPVVNGGVSPASLTFAGAPPFATGIALDGSGSVGATSFFWSVTGPSGPTGALASVVNPTSAIATLNVPAAGPYVVNLFVSDGVSSDTVQRTIIVSETPVVAAFTPGAVGPPVNQSVSFSGNPLTGNITLTSSSSGSPASCQWQVTGPGGANLDGAVTPATVTKSCGSPAILNVPSGSVSGTYVVTLTPTSSLGTSAAPLTHSLTVTSAGSGVVANAGANSTNGLTFTNPVSGTSGGGVAAPENTGIPVAPAISLIGSASTGPGTLTYTWSIISAPVDATGAYTASIASPSSVVTTLTVHRAGIYTVQLFVSNGLPPSPSNTATRVITVNANAITFTTMKSRFVSLGCTGCHSAGSTVPPSWVDETVGGLTLYQRVTARVDSTNTTASLIVRCPAQGNCGMGQQTGFTNANSTNYTEFLNWIISGVPNN
jgi:mono/diheme cytochrome c family protein